MLIKYYDSMLKNPDIFNPFRFIDDLTSQPIQASSYRTEVTDRGLNLSIDVPGVKAADLTVQVLGKDVKVSGKLRGSKFDYSYRLPQEYDLNTVEAVLENGVVTLYFERSKKNAPRTIEIKTV